MCVFLPVACVVSVLHVVVRVVVHVAFFVMLLHGRFGVLHVLFFIGAGGVFDVVVAVCMCCFVMLHVLGLSFLLLYACFVLLCCMVCVLLLTLLHVFLLFGMYCVFLCCMCCYCVVA